MNTIKGARFNDHNGPEVAELLDRMADELPDVIDGIVADTWDGYDAWGSNFAAWFALNDACQAMSWETWESYRNPYGSIDGEDWLATQFYEAMLSGEITPEDATRAQIVFDKTDHALRLAGLDY